MAKWQAFTVEVEGAEPMVIQTSARDWAAVSIDTDRPMDATFRVVHAAMRRQGLDVPGHYLDFLDVLAGPLEPVETNGDAASLDPTHPEASAG